MFSTDFIFRQPEMSGWIQATMQQNTISSNFMVEKFLKANHDCTKYI